VRICRGEQHTLVCGEPDQNKFLRPYSIQKRLERSFKERRVLRFQEAAVAGLRMDDVYEGAPSTARMCASFEQRIDVRPEHPEIIVHIDHRHTPLPRSLSERDDRTGGTQCGPKKGCSPRKRKVCDHVQYENRHP